MDISKTFETLQNNLPHFRNIKTLQFDNSIEKRSPSAPRSQEGYASHYLPFTKNLTGGWKFKLSTITQEDGYMKDNQELHSSNDAATKMVQSSKPSQIIARNHKLNHIAPSKTYDGNKKVGKLTDLFMFIIDINVFKFWKGNKQ